MASGGEGIPAWMIAQAMVIKAKNVLTERAVDILYKEIEAKRMAVNGKFMPMELEKSGEMEQGIFLIQHLLGQKPDMDKYFAESMKKLESGRDALDAKTVENLENAKKFMLAVNEIQELITYGMVFDQWFNDVSTHVAAGDPAEILAKTAGGAKSHRAAALGYLAGSKLLKEDGIFTDAEQEAFRKAVEMVSNK